MSAEDDTETPAVSEELTTAAENEEDLYPELTAEVYPRREYQNTTSAFEKLEATKEVAAKFAAEQVKLKIKSLKDVPGVKESPEWEIADKYFQANHKLVAAQQKVWEKRFPLAFQQREKNRKRKSESKEGKGNKKARRSKKGSNETDDEDEDETSGQASSALVKYNPNKNTRSSQSEIELDIERSVDDREQEEHALVAARARAEKSRWKIYQHALRGAA